MGLDIEYEEAGVGRPSLDLTQEEEQGRSINEVDNSTEAQGNEATLSQGEQAQCNTFEMKLKS